MNVPRCRYIKTNGLVCKSPALTDRVYCYFHTRLNDRHHFFRSNHQNQVLPVTGASLCISALEDTESVQLAISSVINALALGDIDDQRARTLLYGLQLAAGNARHMHTEPQTAKEVARSVDPGRDYEPTAPGGDQVEV